jgi:hypothetical protein
MAKGRHKPISKLADEEERAACNATPEEELADFREALSKSTQRAVREPRARRTISFDEEYAQRLMSVFTRGALEAQQSIGKGKDDAIDRIVDELGPSFEELSQIIKPLISNAPVHAAKAHRALHCLMDRCFELGHWDLAAASITREKKALTAARGQNSDDAGARHVELENAIRALEEGKIVTLIDSLGAGEKLRELLTHVPGVSENKRGFSPKTIQRVVHSILERRKKGHSSSLEKD